MELALWVIVGILLLWSELWVPVLMLAGMIMVIGALVILVVSVFQGNALAIGIVFAMIIGTILIKKDID